MTTTTTINMGNCKSLLHFGMSTWYVYYFVVVSTVYCYYTYVLYTICESVCVRSMCVLH